MSALFYILLAVVLVVATGVLTGKVLLRWAGLALTGMEEIFLGGVLGSAYLAAITFALAYVGLGRRGAFTAAAGISIAVAAWSLRKVWRRESPAVRLAALPLGWMASFWLIYLLFGGMYLVVALMPETSIDGAGYHLGRVSGWMRSFGFHSEFGTILPDGVESLFLFASSIGRHSAATLTEWLFLMALPIGMITYARRFCSSASAGIVAALLVFLSPIVARTGTIAASDVAVACVAFALFWLVQLPGTGSRKRVLTILLAGFQLWIAVPWLQREAGRSIAAAHSPEHAWLLELAVHGPSLAEGADGGLLGPLFLLAPVGLLALWSAGGRRLVMWGCGIALVLLAVVPASHFEARTLVPVLPFVALTIIMAVSEWRGAMPMLAIAAVVMGWPAVTFMYSDDSAWRIPRLHAADWQAALRQEPEDHYLRMYLRGYHSGRMLEERVAKGETVLALSPFQTAYHSLRVLDASDKTIVPEGRRLGETVTHVVNEVNAGSPTAGESRAAAAQALKQAGVSWIVIDETDPRAHEMFHQAAGWGLTVRWIVEKIEVFKVN